MNKTNGVIEAAGASTSLYERELSPPINHRQSTIGFPSFLKWFKKNERENRKSVNLTNGIATASTSSTNQRYIKNNGIHINGKYNSNETLSPPSSPILGYLSPSSSCDSVLSTSTTGFAFIPPSNYQFGNNILLKKSIAYEPDTDTYRARLRKQKHLSEQDKRLELTLRKKYQLYDADTLKSTDIRLGVYDNVQYTDRSLPHLKHKDQNNGTAVHDKKKHRRTASDSSKDKKSGQYVHVKGKRKAPPPPPLTNGNAERDEERSYENLSPDPYKTLGNTSTLNSTIARKKRKAPPPPAASPIYEASSTNSILSEGLFDDKEIKAIIEQAPDRPSTSTADQSKEVEMKESTAFAKDFVETNAARRLTEQQKQILIDNIVKSHVPSNVNNRVSQILSSPIQVPPTAPDARELSPPVASSTPSISPRPWYKRPLSSNRDSAIPFKREVVLKTMEKRKSKYREKDSKSSNNSSDSRHSRSSIFDAGHKFGFFSRNKDPDAKDKEKRRSGIGIPNISELDREAAEILNREQANCRAKQKAENEKFFNQPEHLILQQNMFGSKTNISCSENAEEESQKVTSTKDLISKFEANSSNVARITLNTSFIGRTENFVEVKNQEKKVEVSGVEEKSAAKRESAGKTPVVSEGPPMETPKANGLSQPKETPIDKPTTEKKASSSDITKILWTCPFCTLVNPNWRIICEACERIKPYDKKGAIVKEVKQVKEVRATSQPEVTETVEKIVKADPAVVPKPEQAVSKPAEPVQATTKNDNKAKKTEEASEWEKKAERVMKYFMPRTSANALSKSSSETTVNKKSSYFRKSPSPSKLPVSTPKLDIQIKQLKGDQPDVIKSQNIPQIPEEKEVSLRGRTAEAKKGLLDSSAIVTTVTPVFYAQTAFNKNMVPRKNISKSQEAINIEEVRNARLARFSKKLPAPPMETRSRESIVFEDHDSLEREKRRLREMIRAMNAKALAEKYPVIKKNDSTNELGPKSEKAPQVENVEKKPAETHEGHKLGAIKKIFTKTPSAEKLANQQVRAVPPAGEDNTNQIAKPKKVSSAAQTIVQMPDIEKQYSPERDRLETQNLYAAVQKPETGRKISDKNIFPSNDTYGGWYAQQPKFTEYDNMKVQEISRQLKSVKGRTEFKETLRNPFREMSRTDTIALNKIMRNLELAIGEGKDELAAQIATDLAKMKVALHVTKQRHGSPPENSNDPNRTIIVDISVEDKVSKKGPIQIAVMPAITIVELKQKMFMDFGIPVELQKWIVNNQAVVEEKVTLVQLGVKDKTAKMELFLSDTPEIVQEQKQTNLEIPLTSIAVQEDIDDDLSSNGSSNSHNDILDHDDAPGAVALPITAPPKVELPKNEGWTCPLCTLINLPYRTDCIACCEKRPLAYKPLEQPINKMKDFVIPDELKRFLAGEAVQFKPEQTKNDLNKISPNRKSSEMFNIVASSEPARPPREKQVKAENTNPLPNVANQNVAKAKYRGVDNYNPNRVEVPPTSATGTTGRRYNKKNPAPPIPKQINTNHYLELLSLDTTDYVPNVEEFECPICFMTYGPGEGVILRDCLHSFCKECIQNTVQYSDEAEVKCPYMDTDYSCESVLQEREIKSIVTREIYELHLAKSVRVAEHKIENTFHCKTPNCRGWCIFEDNVNQFKCPVCRITNCLTCRVIHDGLTCKQYQDRLNSDCDSNIEAKRTKEMLQEMVEKGEAMNCPTCQVVMMKKWGCDWLKCSMCKTEICWVTRGPRWGPGGKGDTTAGCKCGVDGKKCHPKCNYCH